MDMATLTVRDRTGKELRSIEADDAVFGIEPNLAVIHQAMLAQLANRRAGDASTKTRGEVAGSTAKIRKQKGSGRARQGGIRAPHHRHGGIVFGPRPREFKQDLPKRMRRLAIRSVLSQKARDGELIVVDALLADNGPKTKAVAGALAALGATRSALVVTGEPDRDAFVSGRNIPRVKVVPAANISVVDMLHHHSLVMTEDAVRKAEALWGGERLQPRRVSVKTLEDEGA
jgi:large subunit ribosomal protein L4